MLNRKSFYGILLALAYLGGCPNANINRNTGTNEVFMYQHLRIFSSCTQYIHILINCVQRTLEFLGKEQCIKIAKVFYLSTV